MDGDGGQGQAFRVKVQDDKLKKVVPWKKPFGAYDSETFLVSRLVGLYVGESQENIYGSLLNPKSKIEWLIDLALWHYF